MNTQEEDFDSFSEKIDKASDDLYKFLSKNNLTVIENLGVLGMCTSTLYALISQDINSEKELDNELEKFKSALKADILLRLGKK
jgi:hypothetical protein